MSRRSHEMKHPPKVLRTVYLLLAILLAVSSRVGAQQIEVTIGNGSGPPGGTATVPFSLTDPTNAGTGAGLLVRFPAGTEDALSIDLPSGCTIAQRLANTHILAAVRLTGEPVGRQGFDLEVAPNPNAPNSPDLPIGTGDIASCVFQVADAAQLGSSTTLTAGDVLVSDKNAQSLPATGVNGAVLVALLTPTPTPTNVPPTNTPTATATNTLPSPTITPTRTPTTPPTSTPTAPPTLTPTATRTNTPSSPTPTRTAAPPPPGGGGGGCTIAAQGSADASPLAWLVVPAAVLVWRRRARN